jgi:hypothetical protein
MERNIEDHLVQFGFFSSRVIGTWDLMDMVEYGKALTILDAMEPLMRA